MIFVRPRRYSLTQVLAVMLSVLLVEQSVAQQAPIPNKPSSKIAEVSQYLSQSDKALLCDPAAAENLAKRALETATSARETDPILIDALGDLKSQSNLKIAAAEKRRAELDGASKDAQAEIKLAHLQTANDLLNKVDSESCYAGFSGIRSQIVERLAKADDLTQQGDKALQKHPMNAIELYQKAESINADIPDLANKIANARDIEHKKALHREHVTIGWTVALVALGALVFWLNRTKDKNAANANN